MSGVGIMAVTDTKVSRSPVSSLYAETSAIEAGTSASTGVRKNVNGGASATSNVHFEYAIYLDEIDATNRVYYTRLGFGPGPTTKKYKVYLLIDDALTYLAQETPDDANGNHTSQSTKLEILLMPARWYEVSFDVSFPTHSIAVKVDGATVGNVPFIDGFITGDVQVFAGIQYVAGPSPAVKAHFDNVLLDVK